MDAGSQNGGPGPANDFVHQALIYASEEEFVDAALPFVREGVEGGEPVLVRVKSSNVDALREALGAGIGNADLLAAEQWYENPIRTRTKFADWVDRCLNGHRIRLLGEPPWPLGSQVGIRDWARHESVINVSFAGLPVTFICPYDARELPPSILEHAGATHPQIVGSQGVAESERYSEPASFCARLDEQIPDRAGSPSAVLAFGHHDLGAVRTLVAREAERSGLNGGDVQGLVTAVNEIAGNALAHGGAPATIHVWRSESELAFDIGDAGPGIDDPLAGQLRSDTRTPGGWGLWMARTLSEAVEIPPTRSGTVVSVYASLSAS